MPENKTTEEKKPAAKKAPVSKISKNELIERHHKMIQFLHNTVVNMESDIKRVKLILTQLAHFDPENTNSLIESEDVQSAIGNSELKQYEEEDMEIVEGTFDGYFMVGPDQKKYPVPMNYSSKTKLIPGDILKLKILPDGKFIYKLIRPAERKHIKAVLSKTDDAKFTAISEDGKIYFLNHAAVTFFNGKPGDELYIVANENNTSGFAAIEAIIKK